MNTNVQSRLSAITIVIGLALMIFKIYSDSEPGLIPLVLVIGGIAWYVVTRLRASARE